MNSLLDFARPTSWPLRARLALAGCASLLLLLGLWRWLRPAPTAPKRDYLCAATPLARGKPLTQAAFAVCSAAPFPLPDPVPIAEAEQLLGRHLRIDLQAGMPFLWPFFLPADEEPPPGQNNSLRWLPLPDEVTAPLSPSLDSEARLDLYAILPDRGGMTLTLPILQKIPLRREEDGNNGALFKVGLSHYQSVLLMQTLERGKVKAVVRRPGDETALPLPAHRRLQQLLGPLPPPDLIRRRIEIITASPPLRLRSSLSPETTKR